MRPCPAPGRPNIALVELGSNGVMAGRAGPHDLLKDRPDVSRKPPRIRLQSRNAAFGYLGHVGIAQNLFLIIARTRPSVQKHRVVEGAHPENRMTPSNK